MRLRAQPFAVALSIVGILLAVAPPALAAKGKKGFADKPGGGFKDPIIEVDVSIADNLGARVSLTEDEANALYRFSGGTMGVTSLPPLLPASATSANQFIRIKFPFNIAGKKVRKSIMKNSASTVATSFLTPNVKISDNTNAHVPGIAIINGKTAQGVDVANDPNLPLWSDVGGKNLLLGKNVLTYVATLPGDQNLSSVAAFGRDGNALNVDNDIDEIRIQIDEIGGIEINGFWVVKVEDPGMPGMPKNAGGVVTMLPVTPKSPVTPPKTKNGNAVVESFSRFVVSFSEPVVPQSVGFSANAVQEFNANQPLVPQIYNANSGPVPNPFNLLVPLFPNLQVTASHNNFAAGTPVFNVPFDVRPINPNNLSQYVLNPVLDMPGNVDVQIQALPVSTNVNPTNDAQVNPTVASAVTSLYSVPFDDAAMNAFRFHTNEGRAFTNVPVSPQALYFASLSGGGAGVVNLAGDGFETNDPSTQRLLLLTNVLQMCFCQAGFTLPGTYLLGCNPNTFGDPGIPIPTPPPPPLSFMGVNLPVAPIGLGHNLPGLLGGPTPIPGINEGSSGTTANGTPANPNSRFPRGFETVGRNSVGDARLVQAPIVGSVGDMTVGEFLDVLFFDTLNPFAQVGAHGSNVNGNPMNRNSISDPPQPNPPPLRLPVGLPPVDVVYSQQNLLKPAFVIEGDEVFTDIAAATATPCGNPMGQTAFCFMVADAASPTGMSARCMRLLLIERQPPENPLLGDVFPTFPQNGPSYQSFAGGIAYAARQQIGNFLYVTDKDQSLVQVLNSNNFSVIDKIKTPDPDGITMASNLRQVYVTNFADDSLSIIGSDPLSPFFNKEINRIKVGAGPRDVAAQPDGEDILVANFLGNSVSIVSPTTQTVRKTLTNGVKRPSQVIATPRQVFTGWVPGIYFAYIANQQTGEILIYESGPTGATGIGADDIRWNVETTQKFSELGGLVYDPFTPPGVSAGLATGVYAAHTDPQTGLAVVSRVYFSSQLPGAGPFPPVPLPSSVLNAPGIIQRKFTVVSQWGGPLVPMQQQVNPSGQDQSGADVALADYDTEEFFATVPNPVNVQTNFGSLSSTQSTASAVVNNKHPLRGAAPVVLPRRLYVSFPGDNRIVVLDAQDSATVLNKIEGVPVPGKLASYFFD